MKGTMRVVHLTFRFDAPGGVETTVRELCRRLRADGVDVAVYAGDLADESRWERRTRFPGTVEGVPVRWFRAQRRPLPGITLPVLRGMTRALRTDPRPSVLHAHSHRYGHVLQAAAYAHGTGVPLVVSTHYHPPMESETAWSRRLLGYEDTLFGQTAYRVAQALVVETEFEAAHVRRFTPYDRVRVIPPGIDLGRWAGPPPPPPAGLPAGYLLFVGRLAENKGLPVLFDALARLPASSRPPLLLMGPDWGLRKELEARAHELGIAASVRFLGFEADPARYRGTIAGATALILPSEWEAFGLVLLEGMVSGTPLIATRTGGVPELLDGGRRGRLVPVGDPARLADAIVELSSDPDETSRLRDEALRAVAGYDWSVAVARHHALYRRLAG